MWRILVAFVRRYWKWLLAAELLWLLVWFLAQGLTMETQLAKRKERFRQALQEQKVEKALAMVSEGYRDQWDFTKDDLRKAFRDITSQFVTLELTFFEEHLVRQNNELVYSTRIRLGGTPMTPVGTMMSEFSAQHREPFLLTWRKEGWWPWTWRLVKVESTGLDLPSGYQPGMFSEKSFEQLLQEATSP